MKLDRFPRHANDFFFLPFIAVKNSVTVMNKKDILIGWLNMLFRIEF